MQQEALNTTGLPLWSLGISIGTLAIPLVLFLDGIGRVGSFAGVDGSDHELVIDYTQTTELLREDMRSTGRRERADGRFPRWEERDEGGALLVLEPERDVRGWPKLSSRGELLFAPHPVTWTLTEAADGTRRLVRHASDTPSLQMAEGVTAFQVGDVHQAGAMDLSYEALRYFLALQRKDTMGRTRNLDSVETIHMDNGAFPR